MKPVVKILLGGCAVLLILGVVAAVLAARWLSTNKDRLRVETEQIRAEARAFGRSTTSSGCVTAALVRYRNDSAVLGRVRARIWLTGCLEGAPADPGFCSDVPSRTEITRTVTWSLTECKRLGFEGNSACPNLLGAVQEHCERAKQHALSRPTESARSADLGVRRPRRRSAIQSGGMGGCLKTLVGVTP